MSMPSSREEAKPFTEKQVELIRTFAAQAVITIENTRLFNELRESLQQQIATADVLKVISRSTFDLQKILDTLTESAARRCEADMAGITRPTGVTYNWVTRWGFSGEFRDYVIKIPLSPGRGSVVGRALLEKRAVQITDVLADSEYAQGGAQERSGYRSVLGVPLLREGNPIGVIFLARKTVRPFTEKQIKLVTTFADQAVIAIENARLFEEVQKRTEELTESLQQQTATADVLKVISRSTFDLQTVLDTLAKSAADLCDAERVSIWRPQDESFRFAAGFGHSADRTEYLRSLRVTAGRGTLIGRVLLERRSLQVADVKADPEIDLAIARSDENRAMVGVQCYAKARR
jgi:GAF domain-containing protein